MLILQTDILKKKNENKYLIVDTTDENKELQKEYIDVWNGIKDKINAINSGEHDYEKDYTKTEFDSDHD